MIQHGLVVMRQAGVRMCREMRRAGHSAVRVRVRSVAERLGMWWWGRKRKTRWMMGGGERAESGRTLVLAIGVVDSERAGRQ